MTHQLQCVKWMVEQENDPKLGLKSKMPDDTTANYGRMKTVSTVGGGLLADEMGLGKTIQSIAVMVHNRPKPVDPIKVVFQV